MIIINTLGALFIAWLLSLFNMDELTSRGINELFDKQTTTASYWFIFLMVGLICDIIETLVKKKTN